MHEAELIAFWISTIRCVEVVAVLSTEAGRAFIYAAIGNCALPSGAHHLRRLSGKAYLDTIACARGLAIERLPQGKLGPSHARLLPDQAGGMICGPSIISDKAQWLENCVVESYHGCELVRPTIM